jgi:hypothetical protein
MLGTSRILGRDKSITGMSLTTVGKKSHKVVEVFETITLAALLGSVKFR